MEDHIFKFEIDYDKEQLIKESKLFDYKPINTQTLNNIYGTSENNDDLSFINSDTAWWKDQESWNTSFQLKEDNSNLTESVRLTKLFKEIVGTENVKPNFFTQTVGTEVKTHRDVGTLCAINFIITGGETPVVFDGIGKDTYTVALLNVNEDHSVPTQTGENRLLFKLRFTSNKYNEVKESIADYLLKG